MVALKSHQAETIPDLAANLTDQALNFLSGFGARYDSVEMELKLWRALTAELQSACRSASRRDDASVRDRLTRVVNRATLRVVAERPLSRV